MLNLDTHILLHAVDDSLKSNEAKLLRDKWSISAIVLWEIQKLQQRGRIKIGLDTPSLSRVIDRIRIWPVDAQVVRAVSDLDFESDPADELIAATSLVQGIPLLTRDKRILGSKLVPLAS